MRAQQTWFLYVLWSASRQRTYVGITTSLQRRLAQHNGARVGGARATRGGRPWEVAACWGPFPDRSSAQRAEHAVKKLRGRERLRWSGAADHHVVDHVVVGLRACGCGEADEHL